MSGTTQETTGGVAQFMDTEGRAIELTGRIARGEGGASLGEVRELVNRGETPAALDRFSRGELAVLDGRFIEEQVTRHVEEVKGIDTKDIRERASDFANGLLVLKTLSANQRKEVIEAFVEKGEVGDIQGVSLDGEKQKQLTKFLEESLRVLAIQDWVVLQAEAAGKSPNDLAKDILVEYLTQTPALLHIEGNLVDALRKNVSYEEVRRLEGDYERLQGEIRGYEEELKSLGEDIELAKQAGHEMGKKLIDEEGNVDGRAVSEAVQELDNLISTTRSELEEEPSKEKGQQDQKKINSLKKRLDSLRRKREAVSNLRENIRRRNELLGERENIENKKSKLEEVEAELKTARKQLEEQLREYEEGVYQASIKGIGSYTQEIRRKIEEKVLPEAQRAILRAAREAIRELFEDKRNGKDNIKWFRKVLSDPALDVQSKFRRLFFEKGFKKGGQGDQNLKGISLQGMLNEKIPSEELKDLFNNLTEEEIFTLTEEVVVEGIGYLVYRDPKALRRMWKEEEARRLVLSDDVIIRLLERGREKAKGNAEAYEKLVNEGYISEGWVKDRLRDVEEAAGRVGRFIKEHKLFSGSIAIAILIILILAGKIPPLAAWPAGIASAAEGVGEKIIGW